MAVRRESVRVDADVSPFVRGMKTASAAAGDFRRNLEQADGRLDNIIQSALALTPALAPIGAAAVPAVAGLVTQMGFAVGAAGAAILAFQGVGDGLKALNDFQLEPTAENFAKLEEAMRELSPAAAEFVLFLDQLEPKIDQLQAVSAEGLFPGVQQGMDELFKLQPQFRRVLSEMADATGDLFAEAGDNLNDPRWVEFFNYLETNARPMLTDMGRTFGNFAEGFAQMVMAFDPLSQDFSDAFLRMSRSFNDWASNLAGSQGFAEFVGYIRDVGPQVSAFFGSFTEALVSLAQAAAPVGSVVLPALTGILDAVSGIASSPVGPVLLGIAAAVGALGRSLAVLQAVGIRAGADGQTGVIGRALGADKIQGVLPAMRQVTAATDALRAAEEKRNLAARQAIQTQAALVPAADKRGAWGAAIAANREVERSALAVAAAEKEKASAIRSSAASIGKTAAVVSGFAVASSGMADSVGLSNTASLALIGTMAGPWGAAIGGGIGVVMDLAAANNDLEASIKNLNLAAEDPFNLIGQREALAATRDELEAYQESVASGNWGGRGSDSFGGKLKDGMTALSDLFTNAGDEAEAAADKTAQASLTIEKNIRDLLDIASGTGRGTFNNKPLEQMADDIAMVDAALGRAGLDIKDFDFGNPDDVRLYVDAIRDYVAATDSVPARSRAVGEALANLESEIATTASSAEQLAAAMDALFGPGLNAAAATDAWQQSLADLKAELKDVPNLMANTQPARDDRGLIQGSVGALQDSVAANAANGANGGQLVKQLLAGRDAIIQQGKAAGIAEGQMREYLNTLGLTPKNLTTIIEASGVLSARQKVQALTNLYDVTPKEVRTMVRQFGAEPTMATVRRLAKEYDLTPKQVKTLLEAVDQASPKINGVQKDLNTLDRSKARPVVDAATEAARNAIAGVSALLRGLDGDRATTYVNTVRTTTFHTVYKQSGTDGGRFVVGNSADGNMYEQRRGNLVQSFADGGFPRDVGRIGDIQPGIKPFAGKAGIIMNEEGSGPWEAIISGHPMKANRSRAIADDVVGRLGGMVQWFADGGITQRSTVTVNPSVTATARIDRADMEMLAQMLAESQYDAGVDGMTAIAGHQRMLAGVRR